MFGKRSTASDLLLDRPAKSTEVAAAEKVTPPVAGMPMPPAGRAAPVAPPPSPQGRPRKTDEYYDLKTQIFGALIDTIDLSQLSKMDMDQAREEIRDIVNDIITVKNVVMSIAEQEELLEDICNDVLGYGPLEPLLARDDIADIMVNGADRIFIEVRGKVEETEVRFRDNSQLLEHLPAHRQPGRPPRRRGEPDLRRAPARRLARQRHRAAALDRRPRAHHPKVQEGQADARSARPVRHDHAGRRDDPADHRPRPLQRPRLRRHRLRQDDAAELPDPLHRPRRARHHLRGRGRAAAAAAARGSPGDAPAQHRRRGRGHDARSRQELPAHAP